VYCGNGLGTLSKKDLPDGLTVNWGGIIKCYPEELVITRREHFKERGSFSIDDNEGCESILARAFIVGATIIRYYNNR